MEVKRKRKRYNRFLRSDESIPRSSSYRRIHTKDTATNMPYCTADVEDCSTSSDDSFVNEDDVNLVIDEEWSSDENDDHDEDYPENPNINFKDGYKSLFPGSDVSVIEAYMSILSFSQRFSLSKSCFNDLLQLLEFLLPPSDLPGTAFTFFNKMTSVYDGTCEMHMYCHQCKSFVCKLSDCVKPDECPVCGQSFCATDCKNKGNYFLYMPIEQQLKVKLEKQDLFLTVQRHRDSFTYGNKDVYKDILDGDFYNSLNLLKKGTHLSLQFNIDGLPMYRKAKYEIWPLQCTVNELPPSERKKNIMICGLWFGAEKPKMETFLQPFVEEMLSLSNTGLLWHNTLTGHNVTTKVLAILCTSDAPARAAIQNFSQFNGKNGCGLCTIEGERVEKGRGYCRIYSGVSNDEKRSFANTVEWGGEAISSGTKVMGVKGLSPLIELYPYFDIVLSVVPDYMHAALLGVTRQVLNLWLHSSKHAYSLSTKSRRKIDDRITKMKPPNEVVRVLRPTADFAYWKASELRTFVRASPILLRSVVVEHVYKHWMLFVYGVTLLLEQEVTAEMLALAERALNQFVFEASSIYGEEEMSYNIHMLLHFADSVRNWGPLWAHSCFMYEDALGKLKALNHGSKGVPEQILNSYMNKSVLEVMLAEGVLKNKRVVLFIGNMMRGRNLTQKAFHVDNCIMFGVGEIQKLMRTEEIAIKKISNVCATLKVQSFKRVIYSGKIFTTQDYGHSFRRMDCIVGLNSKIAVSISKIVVLNREVFFIGYKMKVSNFKCAYKQFKNLCLNILCVDDIDTDTILAFQPSNIIHKYGIMSLGENVDLKFLIPLCSISED